MATVDETRQQATTNGAGNGATIAVENPATGETIAHVPDLGAEQVSELAQKGRAAQPAWEALGFEGRGDVMLEMRHWLVNNRDRMVETIIEETGKTREDALMLELFLVADGLNFWAKKSQKYLAQEKVRSHSLFTIGRRLYVRYEPYGLVGVIGPWNYPLSNSFGDCIPALMAGNSVILKPSEVTPLTSLFVEEGMRAAGCPDGVFQIATGAGESGAALIDEADMIMFTGSTATGKKVMGRAAESLTPVSLELGGKDPMIVLRDADIERAANSAVYYGISNGGQTCIAVERIYVEEPVYDQFVNKVVEKTRALRQGVPGPAGTVEVGAVTFPRQAEIIEDHMKDAREKGAKILTGGQLREGPGRFYEPTVLTGVDHSMKVMTEETFGPVLPIMKVQDADEGLRLANDSRYGLNSSVFTRDIEKGESIANRIEAGNTTINDVNVNYSAQELPFGGWKESGIGVRHGAAGIRKYCKSRSVLIARWAPKRDVHFFPYKPRVTKLEERFLTWLHGRPPKKTR
ncbi:MAG: aldehyde dehydrogenase family protein [Thermoleophilaceae bacterium]